MDVNGTTLKEDGTIITKFTNELYKKKNPYVGDAAANVALAETLGIAEKLGPFKNELLTKFQPYSWTLRFENSVLNAELFEEKMRNYAIVLIALTENLDEVSWVYTVELPDGPATITSSITEDEATEFLRGGPIKESANSPEKLQGLLQFLGISCIPDN